MTRRCERCGAEHHNPSRVRCLECGKRTLPVLEEAEFYRDEGGEA